MTGGFRRPSTPADVERELRQEAGFGCAKCGHPYIEYHHIIPYAEDQHFRPEDMVALCGNCHPALSKQGRNRQYETKHDPHNVRKKMLRGALEYDKRDLLFKVGGNWYENTPVILQFGNLPIISCSLAEGQVKVSLNLLDRNGQIILSVKENDVTFRIDDLWDFEYKHNLAIARYGHRNVALRMDFRKQDAIIEGKILLGEREITLGPNETNLPGAGILQGQKSSNCGTGIQIGDPSRSLFNSAP